MQLPVLEELIQGLSQLPQVKQVILFGSRATGQAQLFSDIDLAVRGVTDKQDWVRLVELVDQAKTLLKIDLVQFELADPAVQDSILKEGQILYDRQSGSASRL